MLLFEQHTFYVLLSFLSFLSFSTVFSIRVIARKLEREKKKWQREGEGRIGNSLPSPFIPFSYSRPSFLDELARNRLLRRLVLSLSLSLTLKQTSSTLGNWKHLFNNFLVERNLRKQFLPIQVSINAATNSFSKNYTPSKHRMIRLYDSDICKNLLIRFYARRQSLFFVSSMFGRQLYSLVGDLQSVALLQRWNKHSICLW